MTENFENSTDMKIALQLAYHIENPCTVQVNGEMKNIREFYLRESREHVLQSIINQYN